MCAHRALQRMPIVPLSTFLMVFIKARYSIPVCDGDKPSTIHVKIFTSTPYYYYPYTGACHTLHLHLYHHWVCATTVGWLLLMMHLAMTVAKIFMILFSR